MFLVTGAAGRSGSTLIREFARRGVPVRALVRNADQATALASLARVDIVEGDLLRPESLGPALADVERALLISSAGPLMLETQCTFIDAARRAGVRHVFKLSGAESGIGFDPENFRSTRNHEQVQRYLEGSGLSWTHLRPSQFMQDYLPGAPTGATDGSLTLPLGDTELSPIDLEDVARIAFALLTSDGHEGKSYDVTGPEALTMHDIAARISDAIGEPFAYVDVAPAEKHGYWVAAGFPEVRADAFSQLFAERRTHPKSRVNLAAHQRFGIAPTTFSVFAARNAAAFRA